MKQWWGPKGFKVLTGQKWICVPAALTTTACRRRTGRAMWGKFIYREVVPQERMVFINSFSDEKGGITRHPGNRKLATGNALDVFLRRCARRKNKIHRDLDAAQRERRRAKTFDSNRQSMLQGWGGTMEQLEAYLASAK